MKRIPIQLQTHLQQPATTWCFLLRVQCKEGTVLGFTTLDSDITYNDGAGSLHYRAANGLAPQRLQTDSNFSVDNTDFGGVVTDTGITAQHILSGLLDYAQVALYRVNYLDLSQGHEIVMVGTCGQTQVHGNQFRCEFRSLMQQARQSISRVYSLSCRADYGDARCGLPFQWHHAQVSAVDEDNRRRVFVSSDLNQFAAPGLFNLGIIHWLSGANTGQETEIETHLENGRLVLSFPVGFPIKIGDQFRIRQDCDKTIETCRARHNSINFRGEHLTPIADTSVYTGSEMQAGSVKQSKGIIGSVLTVVGAIVGAYFGGVQGAQLGIMIGSSIGGALDEPTKVTGPRLTDSATQVSTVGGMIPFGYGRFVTAGNVIWVSELRETSKTKKSKFNIAKPHEGRTKTTTYHYWRDYAVGVCQGPIYGFVWIKRNGKKVWPLSIEKPAAVSPGKRHSSAKRKVSRTARRQHDAHKKWEGEWAEYNGQWAVKHLSVYYGTHDQLPDSVIISHEKTTVSAFRELAYILVKDEELTDSAGVIPNFEFCVIASPPEVYVTSRPFPLRETDQLTLYAQPQRLHLRDVYQSSHSDDQTGLGFSAQSITLTSTTFHSHNNDADTFESLGFSAQSITLRSLLLSHDNYVDTVESLGFSAKSITLKQALIEHKNYNESAGLGFSAQFIKLT